MYNVCLIHKSLTTYAVLYVFLPLRVQICVDGSGRPRLVITPSSWSFLFISGLCGGRTQSYWWCVFVCVASKSYLSPGLFCNLFGQLKHFVCLLWWGNGFSCLMMYEMNSHSTAAEEILHHRSQYGWVQFFVRLYSLFYCYRLSCTNKSIKILLFIGAEIAALVCVSFLPCFYGRHRSACYHV